MGLRRVDPYKKKVNRAMRQALMSIGRDLVAMLKDVCSVRVQKRGSYVIRSEPGEPPRKEFGKLVKSFKYRVGAKAKDVSAVVVFTSYKIAAYLNYGTKKIEARPFWEVTMAQAMKDSGRGGLKSELRRRFKYYLGLANDIDSILDQPASNPDGGIVEAF